MDPIVAELIDLLTDFPDQTPQELFDLMDDDLRSRVRSVRSLQTVLRTNPDRFCYSSGTYQLVDPDDVPTIPSDDDPIDADPGRGVDADGLHHSTTRQRSASADSLIRHEPLSKDISVQLERELRTRLQGHRLVAELGIDRQLFDLVTEQMTNVMDRYERISGLARIYPALLVTYLVGHGIFEYHAGVFWKDITVPGIDHHAGTQFEQAIEELGLETFQDMVHDDKAQRFVGPILAHGGVPQYCLLDYFNLLGRGLRSASDAADLMSHWRARRTAFTNIAEPVRRFLLFGGDLAVDFIERTIDMVVEHQQTKVVPQPHEVGLAPYIPAAFDEYLGNRGPIRLSHQNDSIRPRVSIDPWDGVGPTVTLPLAGGESSAGHWSVYGDGQGDRLATSAITEHRVQLNPSAAWTVSLDVPGKDRRERTFEGLGVIPAMFFDPGSGELVRAVAGLRMDSVWVLAPSPAVVDGIISSDGSTVQPRIIEELPEPGGPWSGYRLREYELSGLRALSIRGSKDETEKRVPVRPTSEKPRLIGEALADVTTVDGEPVHTRVPLLHLPGLGNPEGPSWKVRLTIDGLRLDLDPRSLPTGERAHDDHDDVEGPAEDVILPIGPGCHHVSMMVKGPLGSDMRSSFVVAPGLQVSVPERLLFPGESATVTVSPESLQVDDAPAGASHNFEVPDSRSTVEFDVSDQDPCGQTLHLVANSSRLLWAMLTSGETTFDFTSDTSVITTNELIGKDPQLVVRTGRGGDSLRLSLMSSGNELQTTDVVRPGGSDGRWVFALQRFTDTVAHTTATDLELVLWVGIRPVTVCRLRPVLEISNLQAEVALSQGSYVLHVSCDPLRPMQHRVARLWSITRPWDQHVTRELVDGSIDNFEMPLPMGTPEGNYILEVAIEDGWSSVRRPIPGAPGTTTVGIGTPTEIRTRTLLPAGAIDNGDHPRDPTDVLEGLLSLGRLLRPLDDNEIRSLMPAALWTVVLMMRGHLEIDHTAPQFEMLRDMLLSDEVQFARVLLDAHERRLIDHDDMIRLAVMFSSGATPTDRMPDHTARQLWDVCPSLMFAFDLTDEPDEDQTERIGRYTGWNPSTPVTGIPTGEAVQQIFLGMDAETLDDIRRSIELVPKEHFDLDTFVAANFEWLLADKASPELCERWWRRTRNMADQAVGRFPSITSHFEARTAPRGTQEWASVPAATLALARWMISGQEHPPGVTAALMEATRFAPKLVERDLLLVRALARHTAEDRDHGTNPTASTAPLPDISDDIIDLTTTRVMDGPP